MPDEPSHAGGPPQFPPVPPHHAPPRSQRPPSPDRYPPAGAYPPPDEAFPQPQPPVSRPLRVVVADDNPVVRAGLTVLLDGRDDIRVVAEAADGREALQAAQQQRPDVVLLDVRMPGVDGISALPYLVSVAPVLMLTYSRENEIVHEALRLGAGGYLVHGEFAADQLVAAVRDIKEGRPHFTPTAAQALLAHLRGPGGEGQHTPAPAPGWREMPSQMQPDVSQSGVSRPGREVAAHHGPGHVPQPEPYPPPSRQPHDRASHGLSSREVEVMDLIASGMSNQQIAATCFISEKTVKNHINRIFAKLHSSSRSEAIATWLGTARGGGGTGAGRHG
ncbi:response regulator transcription factor [Streptomyces meridianus]|uniref:Response regulator transcription factor n=1 Tax=Streptomyces meridianus TaxID=2938945 RepID=A0ABT0X177_9ACTN|nr:response regulator transcription factor [Streptomyces meridianus]MCM2576312.1 response regulator transcription factor [Streptomyces meridianus]